MPRGMHWQCGVSKPKLPSLRVRCAAVLTQEQETGASSIAGHGCPSILTYAQVAELEVSSALAGLQSYSQWQQALPNEAKRGIRSENAQVLVRGCYVSTLMQSSEPTAATMRLPATPELAADFTQLVQGYQLRTDARASQYGLFILDDSQLQLQCF